MDIATFHARRRFAETASGRIAYIEDGEGPVALFVHGVPSTAITGVTSSAGYGTGGAASPST